MDEQKQNQCMRKKILIITPWYLPGTKAGGPVRSVFGLVETLKNDSEVIIFTPAYDIMTGEKYGKEKNGWYVAEENVRIFYHPKNFSVFKLFRLINEIKPDALYCNNIWSLYYTWLPVLHIKRKFPLTRCVISTRGMLDPNSMRIKSLKKRIFLFALRCFGLQSGCFFHATHEGEKQNIMQWFSGCNVKVIPNISVPDNSTDWIIKQKGELNMFYLSRIVPIKNLEFAIDVLLHYSTEKNHSKIIFDVYGYEEDLEYAKRCRKKIFTNKTANIRFLEHINSGQQTEEIFEINGKVTIRFKGPLKMDEVNNCIKKYHIFFLPTLNENFGHSIVESMQGGCPVLISRNTPWKNLASVKAGYDLELNNTEEFIDKIWKFAMMEDKEFREWREGARNYIQQRLQSEKIKKDYINLFFDEPQG